MSRFFELAPRVLCLFVVLIGLLLVRPATADTELVLHTNFLSTDENLGGLSGLMCRELARQAFLIAAREELGMLTCDKTLREQKSTDDPLELLLTVQDERDFKVWVFDSGAIDLRESPPPTAESILEYSRTVPLASNRTYSVVSKKLEEASRGEFLQFLRDQGAKPAKLPEADKVDFDLDIDELQTKVDLVSQFVAVRELHRRYRVDPAAETLQALVRGYANLGLLNETNWGASCIALQARALIYSARLKALHPDHPQTLWTLAYADSILGLHYRSLKQLRTLEEADDADELPLWTRLVGPYSRFEIEKLEDLSEEGTPIGDWAAYLNAWTVYNSLEHRRFTSVGRSAIQRCPEAMNLYFMLVEMQPIGVMRLSNAAEIQALVQHIPARLAVTPTIPGQVVKVAKSPERSESPGAFWRSTIDTLRTSTSDGDPSWGMLATLLDDQAMRAAYNSLAVNRWASTEIDLTTIADSWQLFVQGHPDQAYVPLVSLTRARDPEKLRKASGNFRFRDPNIWMARACLNLLDVKNNNDEKIGLLGARANSREFTCQSLTLAIFNAYKATNDKYYKMIVREIGKVAPRSPIKLIATIRRAIGSEDPIKPEQLGKWYATAGDSSKAWYELAMANQRAGNQLATVECFEESIRLSPEFITYRELANAYQRFDMKDKIVPLYQEYLDEVENFGLEHSKAHIQLAKFYMLENDLDEAKPHAIRAARSYSSSGLQVAAQVCELRGDFEEADNFYKTQSNSYPSNSGLQWYLYRLRRDTDNLEAPRKLVDRWFAASPNWESSNGVWPPIAYLIAERDHEAAFKACQAKAENYSSLFSEAFLMLTAMQAGKSDAANESRDRLFQLCDQAQGSKNWGQRFRNLMQTILSAKAKTGKMDQDKLTRQCEEFLTSKIKAMIYKSDRCYFIGKLLQLQGYTQAAATCFRLGTTISKTPGRITWQLCSIEVNRSQVTEDKSNVPNNKLASETVEDNDSAKPELIKTE